MKDQNPIAYLYQRALLVAFWVTVALGVIGNLMDLFLLHDLSYRLIYCNLATVFIIGLSVLGCSFYKKHLNFWFAIIGYAIIANSWFFLITNSGKAPDFGAFFLRETIIVALLLMALAFVSHRVNSVILGFAYVFMAVFVTLHTGNHFLHDNISLLVLIFLAYSVFVYLFTGLLKRTISELNRLYNDALDQNRVLQNTNTRIEEQQQFIEEQKEEMESLLETVRLKNNQLEESNHTKDKFFNIIAHDLRNPAGAIEGFASILLNRPTLDIEKQIKYTDIIFKASKQLTSLLENLLQWARTQTGRISPNPVHISIERVVANVSHSLETTASQKQLILLVHVEPGSFAFADTMMTEAVLRNFLSNAIKYSYRGGTIQIIGKTDKNELLIEVKDTGTGLPAQKIAKLLRNEYEPSEQGTEEEQGTGLGLLVCKEFIRMNKGRFWIESELEKGSTFGFSLPLEEPKEMAIPNHKDYSKSS